MIKSFKLFEIKGYGEIIASNESHYKFDNKNYETIIFAKILCGEDDYIHLKIYECDFVNNIELKRKDLCVINIGNIYNINFEKIKKTLKIFEFSTNKFPIFWTDQYEDKKELKNIVEEFLDKKINKKIKKFNL